MQLYFREKCYRIKMEKGKDKIVKAEQCKILNTKYIFSKNNSIVCVIPDNEVKSLELWNDEELLMSQLMREDNGEYDEKSSTKNS